MASELPDDIATLPATFKNVGDTVNALLAFARAWESAVGKNGISITQSESNIAIGLDGELQQLLNATRANPAISGTFFVTSAGADLAVSAGAINNVDYAGGTLTTPANGDKVYIDATISGTTVTAVTVSKAASVPADTTTHVYTLLATVAVAGSPSVATPTPVAWNYSQMQICGGQALWGGFGA